MKIIHIDISGPYTEEMTYQENMLPDAMAKDGHEVYMFAPCYEWKDGKKNKVDPCKKRLASGVKLCRFEFLNTGGEFLTRKIRYVPGFYRVLEKVSPDIIFVHCPQTFSVIPICRYVKKHSSVKLVADSHSDYSNSALGWISKYILHRIIYKPLMRMTYRYSQRFYYIATSVKEFLKAEYGIDESKMKILPLGGNILDAELYSNYRQNLRAELGIANDEILMVHSGKINRIKRTDVLIEAFYEADPSKMRLVILGSLDEEMRPIIERQLEDKRNNGRVEYLGWKSGSELTQYLCAADIYAQPGGVSATFQNAICCNCAVVSYPHKIYKDTYVDGNGLWGKDVQELSSAIKYLKDNPNEMMKMQQRSGDIAKDILDYSKQGRMIIADCFGS